MKKINCYFVAALLLLCLSCSNDSDSPGEQTSMSKSLTIFHINDQHGRLYNFARIATIIDEEKKNGPVLFVCSGDSFSGNPVVDNHVQKGYPMIDLMNRTGIDVAVLGNHEFDYGENILKERIDQSGFPWICSNIDSSNSDLDQPPSHTTIEIGGIKVTFTGLVETNGSDERLIPLTHPWKVKNLEFQYFENKLSELNDLKEELDSDLFIALTHLGRGVDLNLAQTTDVFDMIIGGHSHSLVSEQINNIPVVQAGFNLQVLGKAVLEVKDKRIISFEHELINLDETIPYDDALFELIMDYEQSNDLDDPIGYSQAFHNKYEVGNLYTDLLKKQLQADICIQNTGGIRHTLDEGPITKRNIYTIDPFNNGAVSYEFSVGALKKFLRETGSGIYYSGIQISKDGGYIEIKNTDGIALDDNTVLTLGINDYIPAVYPSYFPDVPQEYGHTTAEGIISYMEQNVSNLNYTGYSNYFKY